MPSSERRQDIINRKFFDYLLRRAEQSELECRRIMLTLLKSSSSATLLDCGCGDGEFTLNAAKRIGTRMIYGIEITEEGFVKSRGKGIEVYQANLNQALPFRDESFGVILASHIIEHLSNTDTFLKEVYRVLEVGGYLYIATPNLAAFLHILFLLFGKQPLIAEVSDEVLVGTWSPRGNRVNRVGPAHRRLFTSGSLKGLLEHYGLEVEKSISVGFLPLPTPLAKVMCLIDKTHASNIIIRARKRQATASNPELHSG